MAEFLETYQEIIRRKKLLRKLTIIYCIGAFLVAIGIYYEFGLVPSLFSFLILIVVWIPLKKKVIIVLSAWLREKAIKKSN